MNSRVFYQRISRIIDPGLLSKKRVVVIGVGSGGSRVAVELGRAGVQLLLIDRPGERLEEHNIVRHFLGYRSLGERKLPELKKAIHNLNPSVRIRLAELDVTADNDLLVRRLSRWRPDVIAVCTDNEQSKHAINQAASRCGIPQVGAGVYDGGIGGEVYRVHPGKACYGCIAEKLQLSRYTAPDRISANYGSQDSSDPPSTCALNLDIEQIASLQSRMILEQLLGEGSGFIGLSTDVNLCVFANRIVPGTFARPWQAEFFQIEKSTLCLDCGHLQGDIESEARQILARLGLPETSMERRNRQSRRTCLKSAG